MDTREDLGYREDEDLDVESAGLMDERLAELRARDAELTYCGTCGRWSDGDPETDPHAMTVEYCARRRREGACSDPSAHHAYVRGELPEWMGAERDRRFLLELIDRLQEQSS